MKDNNEHINTGNASLDELLKRATSEATAENTTDTAIEDENSATATKKYHLPKNRYTTNVKNVPARRSSNW